MHIFLHMTLREARLERKLRQEDVAERAGFDQGTVSALESGRIPNPTLATLTGLSKALDLSIDEVVALIKATAREALSA